MAPRGDRVSLWEWVLLASVQVVDGGGHHPAKPIAVAGAQAIASACERRPAIESQRLCSAVYLVMAFRESGYQLGAVGDGGRAKGPFQIHQTVGPTTWSEAVAQYTPLLVRSASACTEPLAMLASGSCANKAGIAISRNRMAEARRIVATTTEAQ